MNIAIVGRQEEDIEFFKKIVKEKNKEFSIVTKNPDVVISFGGDGSFLFAERKYPGIPKLIIRHKSICNKCCDLSPEEILKKLSNKEYKVEEQNKIEALIKKGDKTIKRLSANDVVVSNRFPYRALRFEIEINGKKINDEFIGDGIVVATAFGSTGYFHSITKKSFEKGFGVAFNNITETHEPLHFDNSVITLRILRNNAYVSSDNDPRMVMISKDDEVKIKKSEEVFRVIKISHN